MREIPFARVTARFGPALSHQVAHKSNSQERPGGRDPERTVRGKIGESAKHNDAYRKRQTDGFHSTGFTTVRLARKQNLKTTIVWGAFQP